MLFNPIKTICEWNQLGGNWMSHSICCPHATATLIYSKCISLSYSFLQLAYCMTVHLSTQSATGLERKAFLRWVMLFIKLYRNPVACLSGQSISRSSIMISATSVCCYLVMFGDGLCFWTLAKRVWRTPHFKPAYFSADLDHTVTTASKNNMDNGLYTKTCVPLKPPSTQKCVFLIVASLACLSFTVQNAESLFSHWSGDGGKLLTLNLRSTCGHEQDFVTSQSSEANRGPVCNLQLTSVIRKVETFGQVRWERLFSQVVDIFVQQHI